MQLGLGVRGWDVAPECMADVEFKPYIQVCCESTLLLLRIIPSKYAGDIPVIMINYSCEIGS